MLARILTMSTDFCHVGIIAEEPVEQDNRIFVHQSDCRDFQLCDCQPNDVLDLGEVEPTGRGLRARNVLFVERPEADHETVGTVISVNPERGFGFMRPDAGGGSVFLHQRAFADYRNGVSWTFTRLTPGDRVRCGIVPDRPNARGVAVREAA